MMLMEKEGMDMKSALNCFYNSDTYNKLSKPESGLFFQSEGYVYALLHKEITTGTLGWITLHRKGMQNPHPLIYPN